MKNPTITRAKAAHAVAIVSGTGAIVNVVDEDGLVVMTEGLALGSHPTKRFIRYMPENGQLTVSGGVTIMMPASRVKAVKYGEGATDTGANPDFKPTSAERERRALLHKVTRLQNENAKHDRMYARLEREQKEKLAKKDEEAKAKAAAEKEAAKKEAALAAELAEKEAQLG